MQVTLSDLNSSAIETLTVSDKEVLVQFTSGPRQYTYSIANFENAQGIADELSNSTSAGRTFNSMVKDGSLIPV